MGLKYACRVHVDSIEMNAQGKSRSRTPLTLPNRAGTALNVLYTGDIERVLVTALPLDSSLKPKTSVQWVSTHLNVPIEARMYSHLFSCEDVPDDEWEKALNPTSEVLCHITWSNLT